MSLKLFTLLIFSLCYALVLSRKIAPILVVSVGVLILLASPVLTVNQAIESINFNVLGVFLGTMILSHLFIRSGVPKYLSSRLVNKSQSVGIAFLGVCLLSGFISSFTENVACVLIVAPLAFEIARNFGINPVPLLIGVALSSNLQGCATMIGDSPSIIMALETSQRVAHNL